MVLLIGAGEPLPRATTIQDMIEPGMPMGNLMNPAALQPEDVERWGKMLDVNEQEMMHLNQQYVQYVSRHNQLMEIDGKAYLQTCSELGNLIRTDRLTSPAVLQATRDLHAQARRLQDNLERLELEYIDSLLPGLTEAQSELVYLFRNEASRRQSRSFPFLDRWSNVDLRFVWEAMLSDVVNEADRVAMDTLLADYETRVTPLLDRLARQLSAASVEILELMVAEGSGGVDSETATSRHTAIWNRVGNAFESVRTATHVAVIQASNVLSQPIADRFVAEAKMAAFPELYPDDGDLERLFAKLLSGGELDDQKRNEAQSLRVGYREEYVAICQRLESLCIEWGDRRSRGKSGSQRQFLAEELQPLLTKRDEVSTRWLELLTAVVGEDAIAANMPSAPPVTRSPQQRRATSAGTIDPEQVFKDRTRREQSPTQAP